MRATKDKFGEIRHIRVGNIQEVETLATEMVGLEALTVEVPRQTIRRAHRTDKNNLRPSRKRPTPTPLKMVHSQPTQIRIDGSQAVRSESYASWAYQSSFRSGVARRYEEGRVVRLQSPDIANTTSTSAVNSSNQIDKRSDYYNPHPEIFFGGSRRPVRRKVRSSGINVPEAKMTRQPSLFGNFRYGPWYGNYVGPCFFELGNPNSCQNFAGDPNAPPPLTPVDRAAFQHDLEYGEIYDAYGFSEDESPFGWAGQVFSLNPYMQAELGWADVKLIGRSWGYIGEGISDGFYGEGWKGALALGTDVAWAVGITATHVPLVLTRVAMMGVGFVSHGIRGLGTGLAQFGEKIGGPLGGLVEGVGGFIDFVGMAIGNIGALAVGLTGLASIVTAGIVAAPVAIVAGAVAAVVGGVVNEVSDFVEDVTGGCWITEAVMVTTGETDDGPTLTKLRGFRDGFLMSIPEGRRLINKYYAIAPKIVSAIDRTSNRKEKWEEVHRRWIQPAVDAIDRDQPRRTVAIYKEMVETLARQNGVSMNGLSVRSHWKSDPVLAS